MHRVVQCVTKPVEKNMSSNYFVDSKRNMSSTKIYINKPFYNDMTKNNYSNINNKQIRKEHSINLNTQNSYDNYITWLEDLSKNTSNIYKDIYEII